MALCVLAISGCGGNRVAPDAGTEAPSDASRASQPAAHALLRILIPREKPHGRLPRYISAATQSLVATFTPESASPAQTTTFALDVTPETNPDCKATNSGVVCTLAFELARGPYTAGFSTYDGLLSSGDRPTGSVLSANIAFPVTIEPNTKIPVTLYGVPVTMQITPPSEGALSGSQSAGFTLPTNATTLQQLTIVGKDAGGNAIVGAGAPVPSLTTGDPYLKLTPPPASAPNLFGLQVTGQPEAGHVASLSATVTPAAASGANPVTSTVTVTFITPIAITEYPIPTARSQPGSIITGPDGDLWFAEWNGSKIARITTAGSVTEYPLPSPSSGPLGITAGPDNAVWFAQNDGNIGRITTAGALTEFPTASRSLPAGITTGPDGALWFTELDGNKIGRITTAGAITEYPIPTANCSPEVIITGPDGALWFTEENGDKIGRITTAGSLTEYSINSAPGGLAVGPDGALWFTEFITGEVGRMTIAGLITEYPIPTPDSYPGGITLGPDGALWFEETNSNKIGRISTTGAVIDYAVPTPDSGPSGIIAGPNRTIWFTEYTADKVGRVDLLSAAPGQKVGRPRP